VLKKPLYSFVLISLLAACGQKQEAPATAPAPAPAAASTAPAAAPTAAVAAVAAAGGANEKGEHVYKVTCSVCHATGVGGAPAVGSKPDWEPRIAQAKDTLYEHALKGFTGTKGTMPPKGANASLPDDDVKAAVDYMVSKAK
jgi:cytochrome c5